MYNIFYFVYFIQYFKNILYTIYFIFCIFYTIFLKYIVFLYVQFYFVGKFLTSYFTFVTNLLVTNFDTCNNSRSIVFKWEGNVHFFYA